MINAAIAARQPVTIDRRIGIGQHDVDYVEHLTVAGRKVRIDIRSNAYKFQSHAWLDVLDRDAMKWNRVVALPTHAMQTPEGLCYEPIEWRTEARLERRFANDRAALLATLDGLMS